MCIRDRTFPIQVPSKVAEQLTYRTHEDTTETGASTGNEVSVVFHYFKNLNRIEVCFGFIC